MDIIKYDDKTLFEEGKKVYQEHETFRQIAEFMEHPISRAFYDKWIKSPDLNSVLYFLWLYEQIQKKFPNLLPIQRLALMYRISRTNEPLKLYNKKNLLK